MIHEHFAGCWTLEHIALRTREHAFTNMRFYKTVAHEHAEHTNMLRTCEHMLTRTYFKNMQECCIWCHERCFTKCVS